MRTAALSYFVFLLLAHLVAGCAALGVPAADTFNKKVAAATVTVNTASQTDLTLLQQRKITPDESDRYIARLTEMQTAIDATRTLYKTNPADAENRLATLITALNLLVAELEARK